MSKTTRHTSHLMGKKGRDLKWLPLAAASSILISLAYLFCRAKGVWTARTGDPVIWALLVIELATACQHQDPTSSKTNMKLIKYSSPATIYSTISMVHSQQISRPSTPTHTPKRPYQTPPRRRLHRLLRRRRRHRHKHRQSSLRPRLPTIPHPGHHPRRQRLQQSIQNHRNPLLNHPPKPPLRHPQHAHNHPLQSGKSKLRPPTHPHPPPQPTSPLPRRPRL